MKNSCNWAALMNAPVNYSVLHKYRCQTRHCIATCFLGPLSPLPTRKTVIWWRKNTERAECMSRNPPRHPRQAVGLPLQKLGKLLSAVIAAMERCHSSGSAVPAARQKGSRETRACSPPGCWTGNVWIEALPKLFLWKVSIIHDSHMLTDDMMKGKTMRDFGSRYVGYA